MSNDNIYRQQRLEKVKKLRELGINPYANHHVPKHKMGAIIRQYGEKSGSELESLSQKFSVAGRLMAMRSFGKAGFMNLRDRSGELQIFTQKTRMDEESDTLLKLIEVGDFVWAEGHLFRTKTNELTIRVEKLRLVTKAIEQLPEKWHGLTDVETRYRQRYVDLIANRQVRDVFVKRSQIISFIRRHLEELEFLEVETPMMHPIPGGARARPFVTHHHTLGIDLYLRIAPELYLKRLVVGGMERVFEINRNFRNEGISTQHNPEFTMLEFYMAYATFEDLIHLTGDLLSKLAAAVCGSESVSYQGVQLSFKKPFARFTLAEALKEFLGFSGEQVQDKNFLLSQCKRHNIQVKQSEPHDAGYVQLLLFEECVESKLTQPTFITHYPTSASPLSRKNEKDPAVADRFELFICGREIANAFSELNDAADQKERFLKQVAERQAGDQEAMYMDEDFVKALEYGMPPTAGEGIGIDRLVMILTDQPSIRDVILFPILRPAAGC